MELAFLMNTIHTVAFDEAGRLTAEGLCGRRKMTALLAKAGTPASYDRVDAARRDLGLNGVRRGKKVRTTVRSLARRYGHGAARLVVSVALGKVSQTVVTAALKPRSSHHWFAPAP